LADLKLLVVSLEVSLVLEVLEDLLEGILVQDRVAPEVLVDMKADPKVFQALQVQVNLVEGTQVQDMQVPVFLEVLVDLKADPEVFQVLEFRLGQVEGTQEVDREVQADLKADPEVQVDRVEVIQVQGRQDQVVLEGSQAPAILEVRLLDSQVREHQVDLHPTHSSHLVGVLHRLSQTENTYRLTTDNDLMTMADRSYLNVHTFLRSVFTYLSFITSLQIMCSVKTLQCSQSIWHILSRVSP
jgi:hypothetical protein